MISTGSSARDFFRFFLTRLTSSRIIFYCYYYYFVLIIINNIEIERREDSESEILESIVAHDYEAHIE